MLPFALFVLIPRLEKKLLREKRADWRYKLLLTLVVYSTNLFFFLFFFFLFAISASSFSSCTEVLSRYLARLSFHGARYFDEEDIALTRTFNLENCLLSREQAVSWNWLYLAMRRGIFVKGCICFRRTRYLSLWFVIRLLFEAPAIEWKEILYGVCLEIYFLLQRCVFKLTVHLANWNFKQFSIENLFSFVAQCLSIA